MNYSSLCLLSLALTSATLYSQNDALPPNYSADRNFYAPSRQEYYREENFNQNDDSRNSGEYSPNDFSISKPLNKEVQNDVELVLPSSNSYRPISSQLSFFNTSRKPKL